MRTILSELRDIAAPAHTALLIIDMQNDFCTPGFGAERAGRDLSAARRAIPQIRRLLDGARQAGVTVAHIGFATLADERSDSDSWLAQRRRATVSAPGLCLPDSEGAAFVEQLAPVEGELIVRKRRYSAFTATDLDLLLRARDVRTIVVTGVSTNACVETTFRAGFEIGYYVVVPPETCASWDQALHEAALANVRHRFGITPPLDDVLSVWSAAR